MSCEPLKIFWNDDTTSSTRVPRVLSATGWKAMNSARSRQHTWYSCRAGCIVISENPQGLETRMVHNCVFKTPLSMKHFLTPPFFSPHKRSLNNFSSVKTNAVWSRTKFPRNASCLDRFLHSLKQPPSHGGPLQPWGLLQYQQTQKQKKKRIFIRRYLSYPARRISSFKAFVSG